jgi:hypothetical protein
MYLPLETTFAIFVGGVIRWITDGMMEKRKLNEAQKTRAGNTGVLAASGLIAGEAMAGLVIAGFNFASVHVPAFFADPSFIFGLIVMALIAFTLIKLPLANAGSPDEPAPPAAMM